MQKTQTLLGGHHEHPSLLTDPAIEKWYTMKENTHAYFKFNRKTVTISLILTVAVPSLVYFGCLYGRDWVDLRGKKRYSVLFKN